MSARDAKLAEQAHHALSAGRTREAISLYRQLAKSHGRNTALLRHLATAETLGGQLREAERTIDRAIRLAPKDPDLHCVRSEAFKQQGRFAEAERALDTALRAQPDHARALSMKGELLRLGGHFQQAKELLEPHAESKSDPGIALVYAQVCARTGDINPAIHRLRDLLKHANLSALHRSHVLFTLGDMLDRVGAYDDAFAAFEEANQLRAGPHDPVEHTARIDRTIRQWNERFFKRAPRSTCASTRPIFIIGMPRSGTTLVEQILASHPDVTPGGELIFIGHIAHDLLGQTGGDVELASHSDILTSEALDQHAHDYLAQLDRMDDQAKHITDKMPFNDEHLGLIALLFPQARIVCCARDLVDTCLSVYFHDFMGQATFAFELEHIARFAIDSRRLMAHWSNVLPLPMHEVRYESLVENQEDETRALLEFLSLPFDDRCLRFHETARVAITSSSEQIRQPMYATAVSRKDHYEKHIERLRELLEEA